ncbi:MAG: hypothetical protein JRH20_22880, partial [Deltaproteobacteria bacterium]|nr:hypothetical protein [Deltaproteobacteria bacterium]
LYYACRDGLRPNACDRYDDRCLVLEVAPVTVLDAGAPEPDTSAPEPDTGTPEPDTSAPEPDTSAPEPDTSAPEPDTSTPEPDTSAPEPDTSAPEPDAGAPEPDVGAPEPDSGDPVGSIWHPKPGTTWQWQLTDKVRQGRHLGQGSDVRYRSFRQQL